ncbi:MAG: site-specific integrase [Planctomycetota bacterium JB042]
MRRHRENQNAGRYLSVEDIARLEAAARSDGEALVAAFIRFLAETGMRRGEAERLRWDDLREGDGRVRMTIRKTKTKEDRTVTGTTAVSRVVRELRDRTDFDGRGLVFPLPRDENEVCRPWVDYRFGRAWRVAGLGKARVHDLRHHAATRILESNVAPQDAAKHLGMRLDTHLSRYANHAAGNSSDRVVQQLDATDRTRFRLVR